MLENFSVNKCMNRRRTEWPKPDCALSAAEEHVEQVPNLGVALVQHLQQGGPVLRLDVTQLDQHLDDFGRGQCLDLLPRELGGRADSFFRARLKMLLQRCQQESTQKATCEGADGRGDNDAEHRLLVGVAGEDREHIECEGKACARNEVSTARVKAS